MLRRNAFADLAAGILASAAFAQTSNLEHGRAMHRSNCAFCHGLTGLGGRGPDLVTRQRNSDTDLKNIIREGVPGTTMPAFTAIEEPELSRRVAFLRYLAGRAAVKQNVTGDAQIVHETKSLTPAYGSTART
jgi:mono/diheme cytochrome c family protein